MKLTIEKLCEIIREEQEKFAKTPAEAAEDAPEVDADEMATALAQKIDLMKALKIKEARTRRRAARMLAKRAQLSKEINELKNKK